MLSRLVIAFLPRIKHLLTSWLQSPSAVILEPPKIKSDTVSSICHEVMGPDAVILVFWMLSFKPTFPLCSFTFIKRLSSSSSLSAIRMVSSAYLRLLIFLPTILIPACASSRMQRKELGGLLSLVQDLSCCFTEAQGKCWVSGLLFPCWWPWGCSAPSLTIHPLAYVVFYSSSHFPYSSNLVALSMLYLYPQLPSAWGFLQRIHWKFCNPISCRGHNSQGSCPLCISILWWGSLNNLWVILDS